MVQQRKRLGEALRDKSLTIDYNDRAPWPSFTDEERIKVYRKCGTKCFALQPPVDATTDDLLGSPKKYLKYPVCRPPRSQRECKASASGLVAATRRARLTKTTELVRLLEKILQQVKVLKKDYVIKKVKVLPPASANGSFPVRITYTNNITTDTDPMKPLTILKKYHDFLSKTDIKKLSSHS